MEFYEQHPTRQSRYKVDRAGWQRSYLGRELSPYQKITGLVSAWAKSDPRFTNAGSIGNSIRMKMAGILWNQYVLPRCFPQNGSYPWKQDPQAYKKREEYLSALKQTMGQKWSEIERDLRGHWDDAYQQAAREVSQYAVNYNTAARQGRAVPDDQYFTADESDSRVGMTMDDENDDPSYLALRSRAKNRREAQRERDRENQRGGGGGSRAFPAGPMRTSSGKKWKIIRDDD
jgi:hypothetical protein